MIQIMMEYVTKMKFLAVQFHSHVITILMLPQTMAHVFFLKVVIIVQEKLMDLEKL